MNARYTPPPFTPGDDQALQALRLTAAQITGNTEIYSRLEHSEALLDLEGPELRQLVGMLRFYSLPAGTIVFHEGDAPGFMGLVLEGRLVVSKANEDDTGKPLFTMSAGKVFGEMALLDGEPRSATVMAATEATVAVLEREAFEQLGRERPIVALKLQRRLGRLLSQRLRRVSGLLVDYLP